MGQYTGKTYSQEEYSNLNAATGKPFGKASDEVVDSQVKDWQNQGTNVVGAKQPEDIRSLGGQLADWAGSPNGIAVLSGLGIAGAAGLGLKARRTNTQEAGPKVEPTFDGPNDGGGPPPPPPGGPTQNKFTPPQGDVTDVASRPVGESRLQIGGPRALPAPEVAAPAPAATNVTPQAPAAPPAEVAPAAVSPLTDKQRREKAMADLAEHRLEEAKKASAAKEAQQAEGKKQTTTSSGGVNPQDRQMLNSSENAKIDKAVIAQQKAVAPKPAPVVPPVVAAPAATTTAAPVAAATPVTPAVEAPKTEPKTSGIKEISLPKEWPKKGMNWLTSQYGEDGARQFINQYNKGEPFKTHDDMKKVYDQVMTKPSFSTVPKDVRKSRGITVTPDYQQYKIVPNGIVPPTLPSGGGGGGMVVPRGGVGNVSGANEQMHSLNPLKL